MISPHCGTTVIVLSKARARHPMADRLLGAVVWVTEQGNPHDFGGDPVLVIDSVHDPSAVEQALAVVCAAGPVVGVVSPFETGASATAYARSTLGLPGPGFDTVIRFTDKHRMKVFFRDVGLPHAPFALLADREAVARFLEEHGAVVLKPRYGGGSQGVRRISCMEELPAETAFPVFAEAAVDIAREYHIDTVVRGGMIYSVASEYLEPMLLSARQEIGYGSVTLPGDGVLTGQLLDLTDRMIVAAGTPAGVFHTEIFALSSGELILSETGYRPAGGGIPRAIQLATGGDLVAAHFSASCGREDSGFTWERTRLVGHLALPVTGISDKVRATLRGRDDLLDLVENPTGPQAQFLSASNGGCVYLEGTDVAALREELLGIRRLILDEGL